MDADRDRAAEPKTYSLEIRGWYRVTRAIVRLLLRLLTRTEVEGLEHVPDEGPYLLLTNHLHWLDPPALMAAFPYRGYVFAAAKREKHWFFGPLFRSLNAIWVHRDEVDRKALRQALAVLQGGGVLGMAPEGTRSHTGTMQRGHGGAAYFAYRAGASVVPVVVTGQEHAVAALKRLRRARIRIAFGRPFAPPPVPSEERVSAPEIRAFTDDIMYHLAAMLPPQYRGMYSDVAAKRPDLIVRYAARGQ